MEDKRYFYWIQKVDYSTQEWEISGVEEAISTFKSVDWAGLSADYDENNSNRDCPPGIGFHDGLKKGNKAAGLIHITPTDDKYVYFNLQYPVKRNRKRFLFFVFDSYDMDFHEREQWPIERMEELIRLFFDGDFKAILKL